ncbi:hypothetical protein EMIT0373P_70199 [Pseudomonas chlororaphis]
MIVIGTRNFKYLELGSTFTQEQNKIVSDQRTALRLEIVKALRIAAYGSGYRKHPAPVAAAGPRETANGSAGDAKPAIAVCLARLGR